MIINSKINELIVLVDFKKSNLKVKSLPITDKTAVVFHELVKCSPQNFKGQ